MEPPTHSSVRETPRLGRLRRCGAGRGGGAAAGRVVGCWVARLKPLSRNELWTAARHVAGMLRESKPPATAGPSRRHPAAKNTPAAGIFGAPPRAAAAPGGLRNAAPGLPRAESRARPRAAARKSESYAIFVRRVRRFPERCRAAPRESVRLEQRRRKGRATRASTPLDEIEDAFGPYDRRETDSVRSDGWGPSRASKLVRRCLPAREPDARRDFADAGVSLLQALLGTAERRAGIVCGGRRRRAEDFGPRSG